MSDILKNKEGQEEPKKPKNPENAVRQEIVIRDVPESIQKISTETASELYLDVTYIFQKMWSRMEKGNPPDVKQTKELVTSIADSISILPELLAVMIRTHMLTDNYLPIHSANVAILCIFLGYALKYERGKLLDLGIAGMLHDIGMFGTQKEVLYKRDGLSSEEKTHVKEHAIRGANMVKMLDGIDKFIVEGIRYHHEREDGSGYYSKKPEEHISEFAKIINIADTYEALTHPRPYRKALSPEKAMKQILSVSRNNFSDKLIKTLVDNIFFYPPGSLVLLNSGEIARVKKLNPHSPIRPVVEVVVDQKKRAPKEKRVIDLLQKPMLCIKDSLTEEGFLELIEKEPEQQFQKSEDES